MDGPPADFRLLKFSSDPYPAEERRQSWQSTLSRKLMRVDVAPMCDVPFRAHAKLRLLPGLRFGAGVFSASVNRRGRDIVRDDNDDFAIVINLEDTLTANQRGREMTLGPGSAYLMACAEEGAYAKPSRGHVMFARFPHKAVAPLVPSLYDLVARPILRGTEALHLLTSYFRVLEDNQALATTDLRQLVTRHVYDLIALTLNPSRERAAQAEGGLRAGRLCAAKTFVLDNLGRHSLSVVDAAQHCRVSPRQLQRLFESEGLTFSEFLQQERLRHVHGELTDPLSHGSVSQIAYDAGFGDISHFNRAFRRHYNASPTEVRACGVSPLQLASA